MRPTEELELVELNKKISGNGSVNRNLPVRLDTLSRSITLGVLLSLFRLRYSWNLDERVSLAVFGEITKYSKLQPVEAAGSSKKVIDSYQQLPHSTTLEGIYSLDISLR